MKVLVLVSGELDSPIAAYLLHKAGFDVSFIHFDAQPYNDGMLLFKTKRVFEIFKQKGWAQKLYVVKQKNLLDVLVDSIPVNVLIPVWRRFMVRIAERIARENSINYLATGDSLGQVASQTIHNMYVIDKATTMHILRPLLLWNKDEIIKMNHKLNIYNITSLRSSCLLGFPTKSKTKTKLEEIQKLEEKLNIEELIQDSLKNLEIY